jgi:hypothetical protein
MYKKNDKKEVQNATDLCVISDFRRGVYEKCALLFILRVVEW